jgi:DNA-binding MarR family transcriptional regulator
MRKPVTDLALLAYIARKNSEAVSYTEATKACKSSSSASRALHQLIAEGLIEPKPKLLGLRYVTQYSVTPRGRQVSRLALQITELREQASKIKKQNREEDDEEEQQANEEREGGSKMVVETPPLTKKAGSSTKTKTSEKR